MFRDFLNSKLTGEVIDSATGLKRMPKSQAKMVEFGYGQVEPNHLSAQRNGKIYAQLPAAPAIEILEQGQFVKYNYAANGNGIGQCDFEGAGEWMLVYNEIKLYRNHIDGTKQWDCEFALIKDDYQARIFSPYDYEQPELEYHNGLNLNGRNHKGETSEVIPQTVTLDVEGKSVTIGGVRYMVADNKFTYNGHEYELNENGESKTPVPVVHTYDDVTLNTEDPYEFNFTNDPWKKLGIYREKKMPAGMSMVPRVFKTDIGDIFTTNTINAEFSAVNVGDMLTPGANGILEPVSGDADMKWQIVKKYDLPDGQNAVKLMRVK